MDKQKRIMFAGSPEISLPVLEELAAIRGYELAAVLTNPDKARGRGKTTSPSPVAEAAQAIAQKFAEAGKTPPVIFKQDLFDAEFYKQAAGLSLDILVSFAYGTIFEKEFLRLFPLGGINIHPSLLPKYRGPSPIQSAIKNADSSMGISIQKLAEELDSGDIILQKAIPLTGTETNESLGAIAAEESALMIRKLFTAYNDFMENASPQDQSKATFCTAITKADGKINWSQSDTQIDAQIRAYTPWPLSYTFAEDKLLYILQGHPLDKSEAKEFDETAKAGTVLGSNKKNGILIKTGCGIYAAEKLQFASRKALDFISFLNGARNFIGLVLR
ncbi:MAG: methionyl-tRNA formyltransferase [Spirochaetaceae bacterium]|jgi:methionyl-tRNA formyltransferase|nr:methionyl-tRNA formyltransferase [Spirochaetaceae bacterium]